MIISSGKGGSQVIQTEPKPLPLVVRVNSMQLLGVTISSRLSVADHVSSLLNSVSSVLFLMRLLKRRGMRVYQLHRVFSSLIMGKIFYAVSAWGGFITMGDKGKINALLRRCFKYGYTEEIVDFDRVLESFDCKLFTQVQNGMHCLRMLLPPKRTLISELRHRPHDFILPHCSLTSCQKTFINRCLFRHVILELE